MNRAYKYRVYPTAEQEQLLTETFGSCRFVYNHYLALQSENHQQGKAYMNKTACNNDCNRILKQEYPWLKQVVCVLEDLQPLRCGQDDAVIGPPL